MPVQLVFCTCGGGVELWVWSGKEWESGIEVPIGLADG